MRKQTSLVAAILQVGLILGVAGGAQAQAPTAKSPRLFARAYGDLRYARAWLYAPGPKSAIAPTKSAINSIDLAMAEIKKAAADDGKDMNDHPTLDNNIKGKDRLQKVMTLLLDARVDLNFQKDDNNKAIGWRRAAISRISDAIKATRQAMNDSQSGK